MITASTLPYLGEIVGTMLLIIFGGGVVANVCLGKTKGHAGGWIAISAGWGLGVAMAAYAVGHLSGAHLNPALTIALASIGSFPWSQVAGYIVCQLLGGFLGGVMVWLAYLPHWKETEDASAKLGVFSTMPALYSPFANFLCEVIGTVILVFGILAIGDHAQEMKTAGTIDLSLVYSKGISPLLVGFLVWAIGLSLGGPTGYAINPARDLGPRIAHALLPIAGKGRSGWHYAWIPVIAPVVGALLGAQLFQLLKL